MNPKNPQMVATTHQAPRALDVPPLDGFYKRHFDSRFKLWFSFFCMSNMCCACRTSRVPCVFSEHLLFFTAKGAAKFQNHPQFQLINSSNLVLFIQFKLCTLGCLYFITFVQHLYLSPPPKKKTSHRQTLANLKITPSTGWRIPLIVHRKVRKIGQQQEMTKLLRDDNRGHYQPKQCIIIGESLKIIIHFYCLIPPI